MGRGEVGVRVLELEYKLPVLFWAFSEISFLMAPELHVAHTNFPDFYPLFYPLFYCVYNNPSVR